MSVTLEVLKTKQDKCIICLIKVCQKLVTYFEGQETPHRTSRWMSAENWAAYDKKIKELLLSNKLDNLENSLSYKLEHGIYLQFKNSDAPKLSLCEILQEKLRTEDIINVIECKINWQSDSYNESNTSTIKCKMKEFVPIPLEPNIPLSQYDDNLVVISDQSYSIECAGEALKERNNLPSSSDISDTSQQPTRTNKLSQKENKQKVVTNSDSSDWLESNLDQNKLKEICKNKNNVLTEKYCSPYFSKQSSPLKKSNDNDSDQSVSFEPLHLPVEKRKRKLYNGDDIVPESYDQRKLGRKTTRILKSSPNACFKKENKITSFDSSDSHECQLVQNTPNIKNGKEINSLTPKKLNSPTFPQQSLPTKDVNENESDQPEYIKSHYFSVEKRKKSCYDNEETNCQSRDRLKQDKNRIRPSKKLFAHDHKHEKTPKHTSSRTTKAIITPKTNNKKEINSLTPKKYNSPTYPKKIFLLKDINENDSEQSEHFESNYLPVEKRKKPYYDNEEKTNCESHDRLKQDKYRIRTSKKLFELDHHKQEKQNVSECKTPKHSSTRRIKDESTAKKKKIIHEHVQNTCDQEKHSMKNWLSKKDSHEDRINSKLNKDKTKNAHNSKYKTVLTPTELNSIESNKEIEDDNEQTEVDRKSERKLIDNLKELISKKPKKVEILDLVKIPVEKILASFDEHRLEFDNIFQTHKYQTKVRGVNNVDHFLVIDLLPNKIQQKMMEKLSELYEKNTDGTPKYGELFSMVLMPEWILRIFMSHFNMSRTEAILHIKAQNAYKDYCVTDDQLDKMIKKK